MSWSAVLPGPAGIPSIPATLLVPQPVASLSQVLHVVLMNRYQALETLCCSSNYSK